MRFLLESNVSILIEEVLQSNLQAPAVAIEHVGVVGLGGLGTVGLVHREHRLVLSITSLILQDTSIVADITTHGVAPV